MATIAKLVVSLSLDDKAFKKGISEIPKMAQAAQKAVTSAVQKAASASKKAEQSAAQSAQKIVEPIKKVEQAIAKTTQTTQKIVDPLSAAADGFAKLGNNFSAKNIEVPKGGFISALRDIEKQFKTTQAAAQKTVETNKQVGASLAAAKNPISQAAQSFEALGKSINLNDKAFNPLIAAYEGAKTRLSNLVSAVRNMPGPLALAGRAAVALGKSIYNALGKTRLAPILQGVAAFGRGISDAIRNSTVGQAVSHIVKDIGGKLQSGFAKLAGPLKKEIGALIAKAVAGMGALGPALLAGLGGIGAAVAVVTGAFAAITAGAFSLANAAVPAQGIKNAFMGMAAGVEGGSQAMLAALQKASAGMVTNTELMRQFNLAAQLVGMDFAQQLPGAFEHLGKVAMATGQDMGFLLNSLTVGVGRLSPMILDNLGVQVDLTQAYADFAEENNLVASSLTKTQQQAALTAQVMQKLEQNTANMPQTFGSAAQVFGAFRTELANIKDDVGMDLLPTFTSLFQTFQKFLPAIRAFGQGFAGAFAGVVNVAKSFVKGLLSSMGVDFNSLANNAGSWGENIVTQLAAGMARAIGAVISVLNTLGQAIAGWLAPGSPPKLLPELPAWGENAANWFLKGMINANMNILRDLSSQVESFMRSIMPEASQQEIAKSILEIRKNMEQALSGGGNLLSTLPKQLQGYARALLQAEAASKKLEAANQFLLKTQEKYNNLLKPINAELEKISRRQQEVADDMRRAELDAMEARARAEGDTLALELIALERRQMELEGQKQAVEDEAKTAIGAAEEKVSAAQKEQDAAQKRLELEQQLIQHQIETNNLLAQTIEKLEETGGAAGGAAGAGGVGGLASALENLNGAGGGFGGITSSISALAQQIIDQFAPLQTKAEELGTTWGTVFTNIGARVQGFVTFFQGVVTTWKGNIDNIRAIWQLGKENLVELWNGLQLTIDTFMIWFDTNVVQVWKGNIENIRTAWQLGKQNLVELWDGLKLTIDSFIKWFDSDVVQPWKTNIEQLETIWTLAKDTIATKWDDLKTDVQNAFAPIKATLDNFATGIGNVVGAIQNLITWVGNLATAVANFDLGALTALLAQSPPPLAVGIKWVGSEMDKFSRGNLNRLGRGINALPSWPDMGGTPSIGLSGAAAGAVMNGGFGMSAGGGSSAPIVNVSISGNNINNGMDLAAFDSRVKRVVVGALRNRP